MPPSCHGSAPTTPPTLARHRRVVLTSQTATKQDVDDRSRRRWESARQRVGDQVELDHDVIEIDTETWAIHGRIAYDGEVIAAEFASEEEAWAALSGSTPTEPDHTAPPT